MKKNERAVFEEVLDGLELTAAQRGKLWDHHELMKRWGKVHNLSAVLKAERAADVHYADCVRAARQVEPAEAVTDVGSGAGFPGLVWAVLWPDARFVLVEAARKRCSFLQECVRQLGLTNVAVDNARFEDVSLQGLVTSRATVSADSLDYGPLLEGLDPGARVGLLVGARPTAEEWSQLCADHGLEAPERRPYGEGRAVVVAKKPS